MAGKGSAPGERRGGRKKGTPNKATFDVKQALQKRGKELVERLLELTKHSDPKIRLSALQAALDRGFGKAFQSMEVTGKDGGPMTLQVFHGVPARGALEEPERPVRLADKGNGVLEPASEKGTE